MNFEIVIIMCFACAVVLLWKFWNAILTNLLTYFPWITSLPFFGDAIQSYDAAQSIIERRQKAAKENRDKLSEQAKHARKLLSASKREVFESSKGLRPTDQKIKESEDSIKIAISCGLTSHNRISLNPPAANFNKKNLKAAEHFAHLFQQDDKYRQPFKVLRSENGSDKTTEVSPPDLVSELADPADNSREPLNKAVAVIVEL